MTTSAAKVVSTTDNTNRNHTNNNNNNTNSNNSNNNSNISNNSNNSRRNSDASNSSYKIVNNNHNNNNDKQHLNINGNSENSLSKELTTVKTLKPTPVAQMLDEQQLQQQQQQLKTISPIHIIDMTIPMTLGISATTTTTTNTTTSAIPHITTISSASRVMQSDEDFNIRFVNLVRLHKCLYDKKVPEYRNRDNQEKAWSLISQETRESVIHCKERWRNLRACLSRYIKQQSGSDPQHKPYYLTEHMSFLLPFLKSTRSNGNLNYTFDLQQHLALHNNNNNNNNIINNNNNSNLSALFPISAATQVAANAVNQMHLSTLTALPTLPTDVEIKHSPSENDDEETIDAFDPAITATLQQQQQQNYTQATLQYQQQQQQQQHRTSPCPSDTASANSLQNYIPDVQLSEAPSSEYNSQHHHHHHHHVSGSSIHTRHTHTPPQQPHEAKRIKLECEGSVNLNERVCSCGFDSTATITPDMEFFRSILPDIAVLTAQQKRKLKIGILELIDDVVTRYPAQATTVTTTTTTPAAAVNVGIVTSTPFNGQHQSQTAHLNSLRQRRK